MDYELIFWIVAGVASLIAAGVLWHKAKSELYVEWMAE